MAGDRRRAQRAGAHGRKAALRHPLRQVHGAAGGGGYIGHIKELCIAMLLMVNEARRAKRLPGHQCLDYLVKRPLIILFEFVNYFELLQLFRQQFLRQYL